MFGLTKDPNRPGSQEEWQDDVQEWCNMDELDIYMYSTYRATQDREMWAGQQLVRAAVDTKRRRAMHKLIEPEYSQI